MDLKARVVKQTGGSCMGLGHPTVVGQLSAERPAAAPTWSESVLLHKWHAVPILPLADHYSRENGDPVDKSASTTLHQNGTTLSTGPRRRELPGGMPGTSSSAYGC